jgi:hypothetical protein
MKYIYNLTGIAGMILMSAYSVTGQSKIVINDRAQFLTESIELMLSNRLHSDSVELTSLIDNRKRCEYWFAALLKTGNELHLSILDCNDKEAGSKNLGSRILTAADSEKALLLHFAIAEIVKNPYSYVAEAAPSAAPQEAGLAISDPGQHRSRYIFAPSSHNLEKGELYYNTLYFLLHDVQYGMSDQFSLGMGTTIAGFPFYVTPKLTLPVNERSAFALGDMLIIGTWGSRFTGNLFYMTYTRGDVHHNFTVGGGYLAFGGRDINNTVQAPVFNFSSLLRISSHIYFITENYASFYDMGRTSWSYNPVTETGSEEKFNQNMFVMYNMLGFRFINKTRDVTCWQVGLSFITVVNGDIPSQYVNSYYYSTNAGIGTDFFPVPVIGYARKFSTRY